MNFICKANVWGTKTIKAQYLFDNILSWRLLLKQFKGLMKTTLKSR